MDHFATRKWYLKIDDFYVNVHLFAPLIKFNVRQVLLDGVKKNFMFYQIFRNLAEIALTRLQLKQLFYKKPFKT